MKRELEKHYLDAIDNGTDYSPSSEFILKNSKTTIDKKGNLTIKLFRGIYYVIKGRLIKVPKGFVSDGVTTGLFRIFFKKFDYDTLPAGLLHDYLFSRKKRFGYFESNMLLFRQLRNDGNGLIKSSLFWIAVTLFGWIFR